MKKFLCIFLIAMMLLTTAVILPVSANDAEEPANDYQAPVFCGVQFADGTTETTQNVRFVSVVPNGNGTVIGYEIYAKFTDGTEKYIEYSVDKNDTDMETDTVYSSLVAGGFGNVTTAELAAEMGIENAYGLLALAINGVPTDKEIRFYVRTYVKEGDEVKAQNIETGFVVDGDQPTETPFDTNWYNQGGIGTEEYPYVITDANFVDFYTAEHGQAMSSHYSLESDVTLKETKADTWTEPQFTKPLGTLTGTFDGNNHTISGFYLKSGGNTGLFSMIDGGKVENLRVTNSKIEHDSTGFTAAATFAARSGNNALIENCYSEAIIEVTNKAATFPSLGGFVGSLNDGKSTFTNCVFAGTVDAGGGRAAGFVAVLDITALPNHQGHFTNCLNLGSVAGGANQTGGFLGLTGGGWTHVYVNNCINLSGDIKAGGQPINYLCAAGPWTLGAGCAFYIIEEFNTTTIGPTGNGNATLTEKSLAEFLALGGIADAPAGWYFKDGCVPCPIEGLEIPIPATWNAYLN